MLKTRCDFMEGMLELQDSKLFKKSVESANRFKVLRDPIELSSGTGTMIFNFRERNYGNAEISGIFSKDQTKK